VNNVKKNNLTRAAFAVLLLSSAVAGADQQYPAADFQPEVLYQNSDYIAKSSPQTITTKAASSESATTAHDERYPAADFKPEVLYHDPNYKHIESVKATVSKTAASSTTEDQSVSTTEATEETSSMSSYLIGLLLLAGAGFYLFKKTARTSVQKNAPAPARKSYAVNTGVAKYLNKISGTGVSRYLDSHVKSVSAATGVAKYMAKQSVSSKETAGKAATGVDKYMRDRG
jgi:LPXTG-motif cell wall-anchored protein